MNLQPWMCLPFVLVLLSIAILHSFLPGFWRKYGSWILGMLCLPTFFLTFYLRPQATLNGVIDYINFICLLATLYKLGGGLYISGAPKANPITNMLFMVGGSVMANLIGTLGASMLLIRPLLRSNRGRKNETHVYIFFIFMVSNCGGLLTPLGSPSLFYGFLSGVPFDWTLKLFPIWLFAITALIAMFVALDSYMFLKDPDFKGPMKSEIKEPLKILGKLNIVLAFATILALLLPEALPSTLGLWKVALRIFLLFIIVQLSTKFTPQQISASNNFSWGPFKEVAILFAGIFSTMFIAIEYLQQFATTLNITKTPLNFYWLTGMLSSTLGNVPTYSTLVTIASSFEKSYPIVELIHGRSIDELMLMAISAGSVFFGAITYVANGANYLVRSICVAEKVNMPSFFAYMGWAVLFLAPVLGLIGLLFFV